MFCLLGNGGRIYAERRHRGERRRYVAPRAAFGGFGGFGEKRRPGRVHPREYRHRRRPEDWDKRRSLRIPGMGATRRRRRPDALRRESKRLFHALGSMIRKTPLLAPIGFKICGFRPSPSTAFGRTAKFWVCGGPLFRLFRFQFFDFFFR